jgi:DeoR family transcriptional regulator of aga operon
VMLDRINILQEEKRQIANAVVKMIGKGEKVYLSSGSTAYWVAKALLDRDDLTLVINSLVIANLLAQNDNMEVIVVGGFLRRSELSLVGHFAQNIIKDIRVDKVIMGIRGIHPEHGLTSDNLQELMTDRTILSMSENIIIVADHTKFGMIAASKTAPVTAAKMIVTSRKAPFEMVKTIREKGVQIIEV